jgi:SAM-dependent methyltransferase
MVQMPYTARPDLYDLEYAHKDYAAEAEQVARIVRARNPEARTLLDVACGTGKHLASLREQFEAEGVDLDEGLLGVARERLPGVPLAQGDMRTLALGRQFDAVTCLFSAIGFLGGLDDLDAAARSLAAHLAPGGVLIVEPWLEPDAWIAHRPHVLAQSDEGTALARVTLSGLRDERISTTEMHYVVATADGFHEFVELHELYLFTAEEMRAAFAAAGLDVEYDPEGLIGRGLWIATR